MSQNTDDVCAFALRVGGVEKNARKSVAPVEILVLFLCAGNGMIRRAVNDNSKEKTEEVL